MKIFQFLTVFALLIWAVPAYANLDGKDLKIENIDADRGADKVSGAQKGGSPLGKGFGDDINHDAWRAIGEGLKGAPPEDIDEAIDLLTNPDVSMEDAVAMLLMKIAQRMDEKIQEQADKIEKMQGGDGQPKSGPEKPSIDQETAKLKQQVERRGQLLGTISKVIENFEESSKSAIQSLGR